MIKAYHVTKEENLNSIFKNGLLKEKFDDKVVWIFKDYERAVSFMSWNFRELNSIIELNIDRRKLKRGSCYDTIKEYYSLNDIESKYIIGAFIIDRDLKYLKRG